MGNKNKSKNISGNERYTINPGWTVNEFAQATVSMMLTSRTPGRVLKLLMPPYSNNVPAGRDTGSSKLFIAPDYVLVFPSTWGYKPTTSVTSYAVRLRLLNGSMVEVATYLSTAKDVSRDNPTYVAEYPIEAFLTAECIHEFWAKHPVLAWSDGTDKAYMQYPFWVYLSAIVCRLYSERMSGNTNQ